MRIPSGSDLVGGCLGIQKTPRNLQICNDGLGASCLASGSITASFGASWVNKPLWHEVAPWVHGYGQYLLDVEIDGRSTSEGQKQGR